MKKTFLFLFSLAFILIQSGVFTAPVVLAKTELKEGMIVKVKESPILYYIGPEGKRYIFPNDHIYFSWYEDFSNVVDADIKDLAKYTLSGNVRYRPGLVMVKIQTVPKVYAVSANGVLRWIKTEELAKKLYGERWNLLIDDIPVAFLLNYSEGTSIEKESDFNPEEEQSIVLAVHEDHNKDIKQKAKHRFDKQLDFCKKSEKQINQIQKRAARKGIKIEKIGDEFFKQCVQEIAQAPAQDQDEDEDEDRGKGRGKGKGKDKEKGRGDEEKKITICHIPPGNPTARHTITVGVPAAKAHLAHGDTLGPCEGVLDKKDKTPPVISNISATSTSPTSATIKWITDEPATNKVIYATVPNATTTSKMVSDSVLVTQHSILLTDLATSTQYFFRVESKDINGNVATSTEMTFTTLAQPIPEDTTPPVISGITATSTSQTTTTIKWTTDEPSTSKVIFANQSFATATSTQNVLDATLVTQHSLALTRLATSTQYFYKVESSDGNGNTATSTELSFTTQP